MLIVNFILSSWAKTDERTLNDAKLSSNVLYVWSLSCCEAMNCHIPKYVSFGKPETSILDHFVVIYFDAVIDYCYIDDSEELLLVYRHGGIAAPLIFSRSMTARL